MPSVVRLCALLGLLLQPAGAVAQEDTADQARAALQLLDEAGSQLDAASNARDRVRALTSVIQAYEEGLGALRESTRQVSVREAELASDLASRDAEIATLLIALQRASFDTSPVFLLHPAGPAGSVRAGILLSTVAPVLQGEADLLRADLEALRTLQSLQTETNDALVSGLEVVQGARSDLNAAIADRAPLPKRFLADPVREAILISSSDTLEVFAAGLDELSADTILPPPDRFGAVPRGELDLPVRGHVLRRANEADAAGIVRPGMIVSADAQALVSSPAPGTLRYVGPLLDFGQVVILEPEADVLFVLAGLGTVYVETGDLVEMGAPLGLIGTSEQKTAPDLSTDSDQTGAAGQDALYIEVRHNNKPEDPSLWFRTDKDG